MKRRGKSKTVTGDRTHRWRSWLRTAWLRRIVTRTGHVAFVGADEFRAFVEEHRHRVTVQFYSGILHAQPTDDEDER